MKSIHLLIMSFGGFITLCYVAAVLKLGTNGMLFTGVTNALLAMLMITALGGDKQKLKKVLALIIGDNNGERKDIEDAQGPSEQGRDLIEEESRGDTEA